VTIVSRIGHVPAKAIPWDGVAAAMRNNAVVNWPASPSPTALDAGAEGRDPGEPRRRHASSSRRSRRREARRCRQRVGHRFYGPRRDGELDETAPRRGFADVYAAGRPKRSRTRAQRAW
jgi:hypothetical protein